MKKLVFLFNNNKKFAIRITEQGFIKTCEEQKVSPSRIIALNQLSCEPSVGQLIYIERQENSFLYRVSVTDSLSHICEKFSVTKESVLNHNKINDIYPYQLIEIIVDK